jgi:hypothetical protein
MVVIDSLFQTWTRLFEPNWLLGSAPGPGEWRVHAVD